MIEKKYFTTCSVCGRLLGFCTGTEEPSDTGRLLENFVGYNYTWHAYGHSDNWIGRSVKRILWLE